MLDYIMSVQRNAQYILSLLSWKGATFVLSLYPLPLKYKGISLDRPNNLLRGMMSFLVSSFLKYRRLKFCWVKYKLKIFVRMPNLEVSTPYSDKNV